MKIMPSLLKIIHFLNISYLTLEEERSSEEKNSLAI